MPIAEACKESIWLIGLFADICGDDTCINLFCGSQSVIYLTKYHMFHERTKQLKVCNISTHDNPTNMMTKSVTVAKFDLWSGLDGITV